MGRPFTTLELRDLGRDHGPRTALAHLSLTVGSGEFVALLGPSGAGKSTALHCVCGLLAPTRGAVLIDGQPIDHVPAERRDFGVVFQHHALFPHLSVRDNVAFGLTVRHLPPAEVTARVGEALERVGLTGYADRSPGQLSGGQQQRVAIARAIVLRPRLLLMDEPLSDLDPGLRLELRGEIKRLHRDLGLTTLYVTHDQEEALSLADRLVVLRTGRVEQIGTPQELHEAPKTWQIAEFVGHRTIMVGTLAASTPAGQPVTVRLSHHRSIIGTATSALSGGGVRVAIRPEDVEVDLTEAGTRTCLTGTVLVTEYLGRRYGVTVAVADQHVHAVAATDLAPGATVGLSVPAERVLVYPADC